MAQNGLVPHASMMTGKDMMRQGTLFRQSDIADPLVPLPQPTDPAVVRQMVKRGRLVFTLIFVLSVLVMPAAILGIGLAVLWLTGTPVCGELGQFPYLGRSAEGQHRCGTHPSWEFYLGVTCLGIVFVVMVSMIPHLFALRKAGETRRTISDEQWLTQRSASIKERGEGEGQGGDGGYDGYGGGDGAGALSPLA